MRNRTKDHAKQKAAARRRATNVRTAKTHVKGFFKESIFRYINRQRYWLESAKLLNEILQEIRKDFVFQICGI